MAGEDDKNYHREEAPHNNDILCGRGGLTNIHPGNVWYRSLIRSNRPYYRFVRKHGKMIVSKAIVHHVCSQNPPSRFLEQDPNSSITRWIAIPRKRAIDKTSQALRERNRSGDDELSDSSPTQHPSHNLMSTPVETKFPELILTAPPDFKNTVVTRSARARRFDIQSDMIDPPTDSDTSPAFHRMPGKRSFTSIVAKPASGYGDHTGAMVSNGGGDTPLPSSASSMNGDGPVVAATLLNLRRKACTHEANTWGEQVREQAREQREQAYEQAYEQVRQQMLHQVPVANQQANNQSVVPPTANPGEQSPEFETMVERISSRFRRHSAKRPRTLPVGKSVAQLLQRPAAQYCRDAAMQHISYAASTTNGAKTLQALPTRQYQYPPQQQHAFSQFIPHCRRTLAASQATSAVDTNSDNSCQSAVNKAPPQQHQTPPPSVASVARKKVSPAEQVALSTLTQFLPLEKKPTVASMPMAALQDVDDQFADSQDDQFADPEEELISPQVTPIAPPKLLVPNPDEKVAPVARSPIGLPGLPNNDAGNAQVMRSPSLSSTALPKKDDDVTRVVPKTAPSWLPSKDEDVIARVEPAVDPQALPKKDENGARELPASDSLTSKPALRNKFGVDKSSLASMITISRPQIPEFYDPHSTDINAGALCRICHGVRFDRTSVPKRYSTETHPELSWPIAKVKSRRAIKIVLKHCTKAHPHWPLWNTLSSPVESNSLPEAKKLKAIHVFHEALRAACSAAPHKLGDRYNTWEEMSVRIAHRLGLAEGFIKWGQWETCQRKALEVLALAMIREYERTLLNAVRHCWDEIERRTHQERVDLFNNSFVVPYCVDNVREKGELFPPVCPPRCQQVDKDKDSF